MNLNSKKTAPNFLVRVLKKLLGYFSVSTVTILGTFNAAQAVDLTANDIWADAISGANGTIADPSAAMAVDLKGFALSMVTAGDGVAVGALTDTGSNDGSTASLSIINTNNDGALTQTIASIIVDGTVTVANIDAEAHVTLTVGGASASNVIGGTLDLTSSEATADANIVMDVAGGLEVTGATTITANTGSSASNATLIVDKAATFTGGVTLNDNTGLAILEFEQNNAVTIAGNIAAAANGEGTIQMTGTGKTLSGTLGASDKKLKEVQVDAASGTLSGTGYITLLDVNAAVTLSGAMNLGTATIDAATASSGGITATTVTMGAGDVLTVSDGNVTSAIVVTDSTSSMVISGSDVTVTGDINAAGATDAGIISVTGDKATFAGNLGAASGTNILTLSVAASKRAVITETANFVDQVDMAALGELEITKAVTSGTVITAAGSTWDEDDLPSGAKIYMPVNLVGGETLTFAAASDSDDLATAIDAALQDTALIDYSAANSSGTHTVTATSKTTATIGSELSITDNDSLALSRALVAITDTTTDVTAETALYNAMTANGGFSSTEDSSFAKQVAPQTDLISGSSTAAQGVTGSLQGIMSNRMASLRSGDAYFGTGVAAGGMSAKSGFIQVFGSTAEQESTKVGSGTQAGFDSDTQGLAIGLDGVNDDGMTVGVSLATANTDVDGKGTGKSTNSIDTYSASLYMDTATENGYVEGSLTFGVNENSTSRKLTSAGLNRTLTGSYDSNTISLNLAAGMPNEVGAGYLTPFGSFTATVMDTDAYTEKSAVTNDALRLKVAQDDISSMIGTVGLKFHGEMSNGGMPMISLAINNEFGDNTIESTNTFQGGGTAFKTTTAVEELSATLGLGYSYATDATSIEFAYEADANDDDYLSHYGSIKIVSKF